MINYSIIIPHYNIPELLIRCIRSIPERNDVEVIIVDDNSPDGENYPQRYSDLKRNGLTYIHLDKNIGGGGARNIGLKHAKGKWLIFADADDFFNYCFNDVLDEYIDCHSDVIYFKANSIDTLTYINTERALGRCNRVDCYLKQPNEKSEFFLRFETGEPWCKIIRRDITEANKIEFEETPINNDTRFAYLVGYYAKTIGADKRAIYCLTDREKSVSRTLTPKLNLVRLSVYCRKYNFLYKKQLPTNYDLPAIIAIVRHFYELEDTNNLIQCEDVLAKYGINFDSIIKTIKHCIKKEKIDRFKRKIIDRINIETIRLLKLQ